MKRRIINILIVVTLLFSVVQMTYAANFNDRNVGGITVYVDGLKINFDTQPTLINNRTMVPMRAVFEALGAKVDWDSSTQTAIGKTINTTIKITIGQNYLLKNDEQIQLDSPAVIISGRTLVPVRAIAESLDCNVNWIGDIQVVDITSFNIEDSAENYVGEWNLVGFINDYEEFGYVDESFGTINFRSDGTVLFSSFDGESSALKYETSEDGNVVIRDNEYIMIGSISSESDELHLREYHVMKSNEDTSWTTQKNNTIKRKIFKIDNTTYVEAGYGHILRRID